MVKPVYFPLITPVSSDTVTLVLLYLGQFLLIFFFLIPDAKRLPGQPD